MLTRFKNYIEHHDLVGPGDRILLAVSGGLDSMVMLHFFQACGYSLGVAHANFGLRGKESDGDESFVREYCGVHKIPFYGKRFDTKNYAERKNISVQMAARDLRYGWFNELMAEGEYHWLATAHHLNDNVETVILRWTNGAGLDQLTGIPRKNERIVRPLLFASRAEIDLFAQTSGIAWREDSSNLATNYQRNFIRHEVIPKLKEINPSLEATFMGTLEKLEGASELMRRGIEQLKDSVTRKEGRNFLIDKNLLLLLRNPAFICYEWLRPYGFEFDRCKQLVAAISSQSGSRFMSVSHIAVIDREYIIVSPKEAEFLDVLVEDGQDKAVMGPWVLSLRVEKRDIISEDPASASLDYSSLRFPLLWRRWRPGDAFVPLGMKKTKKVSDFLIDERVPVTEKNRVTVLSSGEDIVWLVGYRVDDRFKVTRETEMVLALKLESRSS